MSRSRARDVSTEFAMKGAERASKELITELFEVIAQQRQEIREMAVIQLQMAQQMEQIVQGANGIRKQVERMQNINRDDDDLPTRAS